MSLAKSRSERLAHTEWVSDVHMGFQQQIVTFLLWAYGFLIVATIVIILFQGFHFRGFNLDPKLLFSLGGATIGEVGGLLVLTFREVFK